jgi:hypothetical protein
MVYFLLTCYVKVSRVCLTAFWDYMHHLQCTITCKTERFCAKYDSHRQPSQPSAFRAKWNTGSLTVAQDAYEAPGPGVMPFEDFIQSRESNKTHNTEQHDSKTLHSFGQAEARQ